MVIYVVLLAGKSEAAAVANGRRWSVLSCSNWHCFTVCDLL